MSKQLLGVVRKIRLKDFFSLIFSTLSTFFVLLFYTLVSFHKKYYKNYFKWGMGQYLPVNSNHAVLYGIEKYFETSKFHSKQRYLNLTAKIDPLQTNLKKKYLHYLKKPVQRGSKRVKSTSFLNSPFRKL